MSLANEHALVLIGLAGPMDVVNLSLSLSLVTNAILETAGTLPSGSVCTCRAVFCIYMTIYVLVCQV